MPEGEPKFEKDPEKIEEEVINAFEEFKKLNDRLERYRSVTGVEEESNILYSETKAGLADKKRMEKILGQFGQEKVFREYMAGEKAKQNFEAAMLEEETKGIIKEKIEKLEKALESYRGMLKQIEEKESKNKKGNHR